MVQPHHTTGVIPSLAMITADSLPDDIATLKALVLAGQAALADAEIARLTAESKARNLEAEVRARTLLIEQMKFTIAKLKHEQYGQSSERSSVLEQLELELADLEEDASEAEAEARRECPIFCVRGLCEG
jgi:transposase